MGIVIRKTISTSIINYLGVLLGVVNVLWLQTAIISELQIGILNYVVDISIILLPLILFGTSGVSARFIHIFKEGNEKNGFLNLLLLLPIVIISLVFIICVFFQNEIITFLGKEVVEYKKYLVYIFPLLFTNAYQFLLEAILATKSLTVFSTFLKYIFRRLVLIGLLIIFHYNLIDFYQLLSLYVLAHFLEIFMLFIFFKNQLKFKFCLPKLAATPEKKKEIIMYALFLILTTGGVFMIGKIDTIMISSIVGDFKQLGVYAVAFFIASIIEVPKRIVHQLVIPIMSVMVTENRNKEFVEMFQQTGINMAIFSILIFMNVWYSIDELFLLIPNGDIYRSGKWVIFFIGLSKVIDVVFGTTDIAINVTKHYKWNGILAPFLIFLTFFTNYLFIHYYGIVGAAIGTLVTVFTYFFIKYIIVIIKLRMNLLSKKYIGIVLTSLLVMFIFMLKPNIFDNHFLEIVSNSILITFIFIGGNYLLKSSKEMNQLIDNSWNKYIRKT